jgi:hypothetical protein
VHVPVQAKQYNRVNVKQRGATMCDTNENSTGFRGCLD